MAPPHFSESVPRKRGALLSLRARRGYGEAKNPDYPYKNIDISIYLWYDFSGKAVIFHGFFL